MPRRYPGEMELEQEQEQEQDWVVVGIRIIEEGMPRIRYPGTKEKELRESACPDFRAVQVMVRKPRAKARDLRDPKAANQALRTGTQVQTMKKFDARSNKKAANSTAVDPQKLEEAEEPEALDRVSAEVRKAIQKARIEKKMRQTELAKQINEWLRVIQEYENGKAVPNQAILAKMEKVLGVKLRGLKHK